MSELLGFARLNRGKIQIVSRFAFYEFSVHGEKFEKMSEDFPGTAVSVLINTADTEQYVLQYEKKDQL